MPALVSVLHAHPFVAAVAEQASKALQNMALNSAGQEACAAAGVVPALVAALKALAEEGSVPATKVAEAIAKYGIKANKINPLYA